MKNYANKHLKLVRQTLHPYSPSPLSCYKECSPLNTLECLNPKTLQTLKHTEAIQREQYVRRNRNMFGRSPCAHRRRSAQQCSICQSGRTHRRSGAEQTSLAIARGELASKAASHPPPNQTLTLRTGMTRHPPYSLPATPLNPKIVVINAIWISNMTPT
jgi:hypothetical protein